VIGAARDRVCWSRARRHRLTAPSVLAATGASASAQSQFLVRAPAGLASAQFVSAAALSAGLSGLTFYPQALVEHPQGLALTCGVRVVLP
jgi:hypothetical protein